MVILRKNRIILTGYLIILCLLSCVYSIFENKDNETISTVALPISNKVIVLDAGHGLPDKRGNRNKQYK